MNPCFDDSHPSVSADVLPERIRERAETRGLLWMAADVITFVITFAGYPALSSSLIPETGSNISPGRSPFPRTFVIPILPQTGTSKKICELVGAGVS